MAKFYRYFMSITWVLIALMGISLFFLENAYTMPLLLLYIALRVVRHRKEIADVRRRSTPRQKAIALGSFVAAVAAAYVLIVYGGRCLQALGLGRVALYSLIAFVIAVVLIGMYTVIARSGFGTEQPRDSQA
ncbi:hypothetical protein [Saccharibacillus kuerlensis]|uniref:DUF2178 domain-containing protein n=1 Tax=Saccharibacillus kuerlensis TaxID=459527 RepID=A0ABQ2L8Y3_9BACL|nr:hypothetical protein [Saccharibacillus kuerlensis]GGO05358.1 hypothetical protein GCM10010969_31680 [Saccharibacillus kuerlensis]